MVQWFRGGSEDASASEAPPPPGGTGGSGFGGVGGAPAGPEAHPSAGERRDATLAGRAPRRPATAGAAAPDGGSSHRAGASASAPSVRRGLPKLSTGAASTPEERRFSQVYAEDRVGPMPYPNQASPDIAEARARVRALVEDLLPNGVDEGTGGALDPLIASWASGWLARIDSEHADHHAVVDRLVGGARQQLADAEAAHERDQLALEIARHDYADARERLMDPVPEVRSSAGRSGGSRGGDGEPDRRGSDAGPERSWLDRVGRPGRSHDLDHDHGRSAEPDAERRRLGDRVVDRLRSPLDDPEPPRADDAPDRDDRFGSTGTSVGGSHRSGPRPGAPDPATGPYPVAPASYGTTAIPPSAPERPGGDR